MTHLLHPDDDKWNDLGGDGKRIVDRPSHILRWQEASKREYLEKSDMGKDLSHRSNS